MKKRKSNTAFTLIELSIVLVIISLIVGGVLVGQSLIKAAELRSVMTDIEKFKTATMTFRLKYNCLAGDCNNATQFFGTQADCTISAIENTSTSTLTCNGNGDKKIWSWFVDFNYTYAYEHLRFWQQLSAAGLIEGSYTGIGDTSDTRVLAWSSGKRGWNIPASNISDIGYTVIDASRLSWDGTYFPTTLTQKNKFTVGADTRCVYTAPCAYNLHSGIHHAGAVFTPTEALSIDTKYDDGLPGKGQITAPNAGDQYFGLYCSTSDSADTAEYSVGDFSATITSQTKRCPIFVEAGF